MSLAPYSSTITSTTGMTPNGRCIDLSTVSILAAMSQGRSGF